MGAALLLVGCSGGKNETQIVTTWKLQKVTGGFTGGGRAVNGVEILELTDTTATYRVNGKVEWQRSYERQTKKEGERTFSVIAFNPVYSAPNSSLIDWEIIENTSTKLLLADYNLSDGFQYEFSAP